MKIRGRLIIAFLIMTIFPIVIMLLCVTYILNRQCDILASSYSINADVYNDYDIILNPVNFFYNVTLSDYEELNHTISNNPDALKDKKFLEKKKASLAKKESFLVVVANQDYYYIGNDKAFLKLASLPIATNYDESKYLTYIDQKTSSIIREKTFYYSDHSLGQAFLITDFSKLRPRWKRSINEIFIAFLLIVLITGIFLTIWIYQSIVRPISILRLATMQIGAGNLDKPIRISSADEIGQLCRDFEEMRIRLKNMVDHGMKAEENTREIMSSISHDLKTPITAIKGYTEGILDGVADSPEKQKKYLHTIYSKANDMAYLIDELSVFSKVEQNSLAYNFISINLENYFADCIEDASLDLESQNITIDYYNSVNKATNIAIDPEQMKRVLHNIIGNAVKYNDKEKGHISIRIEDVPVQPLVPPLYRQINDDGTDVIPPRVPDEFIQVQIEDNGPGIAARDLPHIFDRFFRADASRNSSKRGSGLGLAIVKMIILDHGGKIWAESIEGVGSSFYFTLKKDLPTNGGAYEQNIDC